MNTTKIGSEFEDEVFTFFSSLLNKGEIVGTSQKYSKIQKHKKYKTNTSRIIDCDITIENYNPFCNEEWSSLIIIECKRYKSKVDIADLDEFQTKMNLISSSGVKGIMVTTVGFSKNTIEQAKIAHVGLLVLNGEKFEWSACRNVLYRQEDLMYILCGEKKIGTFPVVYDNGCFSDILNVLSESGAVLNSTVRINVHDMTKSQIEKIAMQFHDRHHYITNDIAGEVLARFFPNYRIRFEDLSQGLLGKLSFSSQIITISNEIINDTNRLHFTLAHEVGHIVLHKEVLEGETNEIEDYLSPKLSLASRGLTSLIEKQANWFASYLLMPKDLVILKLATLVKKYGITHGYLYIDNQPCNYRNVNAILAEMSQLMGVSKEAIRIRLKELNLLREENYQPRRINQFLKNYL